SRHRLRERGHTRAEGKGGAAAGLARRARDRDGRRWRACERPRGTLCRPRRGVAARQGSVPRCCRRAAGAARLPPRGGGGPGGGGIGKSRLSWEFQKYLDGVVETILWPRGRCLAYGEGVAFWALAEMVRRRAGIVEEEAAGPALEKLRRAISEHVPDTEEAVWLEPRLAHLLGLGEAAAAGPGGSLSRG